MDGRTVASSKLVVVVVAMGADGAAGSDRYTVYPATAVLSCDAFHVRATEEAEIDPAVRPVGWVGGSTSSGARAATSSKATSKAWMVVPSPSRSRPIGAVPSDSTLLICGVAGSSSETSTWPAVPLMSACTTRWCQTPFSGTIEVVETVPVTSFLSTSSPAMFTESVTRFEPEAVSSRTRPTRVERLTTSNQVSAVSEGVAIGSSSYAYAGLALPWARAAHEPANTSCCWATRPMFAVQADRSPLSNPSAKTVDAAAGARVTTTTPIERSAPRAITTKPFRLRPPSRPRSNGCNRPRRSIVAPRPLRWIVGSNTSSSARLTFPTSRLSESET